MIKAELKFHKEITEEQHDKLRSYFYDLDFFSNEDGPPKTVVITVGMNEIRVVEDKDVYINAILEFSDYAKIMTVIFNGLIWEIKVHN